MNARKARIGTGNGRVRLFAQHVDVQPADAKPDAANLKELGYGG